MNVDRGLRVGAILVVFALASLDAHDPLKTTVSWTGDIERLVKARCVGCHAEGGRGPMPLETYEDARPWARAIREEVLTRRMPKWHAARGYGRFANDRSLTPFEIALFVAWVDGGARKESPGPTREAPVAVEDVKNGKDVRSGPSRSITVKCGEHRLPRGRLLAVRPDLDEGGSAGITILLPGGAREIVAWIRGFEREFAETYWLRDPIEIPRGSRVRVEGSGRCRVELTLEPRTNVTAPRSRTAP